MPPYPTRGGITAPILLAREASHEETGRTEAAESILNDRMEERIRDEPAKIKKRKTYRFSHAEAWQARSWGTGPRVTPTPIAAR